MATFEEVLKEERSQIFGDKQITEEPEGVGLAFSGGGIRSATFNLGILQGLSRAGLLDKIDYLSTVSGGGYIGGWLISWILREKGGITDVQKQLGDYPKFRPEDETAVEPKQVNFLRDYSNYMTPRLGIFGADTWAAIATYLRNVMLNQLILVGFLGAVVMLPWCILTSSHWISTHWSCLHNGYQGVWVTGILAAFLLILGVCWASWQCARSTYTVKEAPATAGQNFVLGFVALPLFLSAVLTMITLWLTPGPDLAKWCWWYWVGLGAGIYAVPHILGIAFRWQAIQSSGQDKANLSAKQAFFIPITAAFAGAIGGLLLELAYKLIVYWQPMGHGFAHALTWGPAIFVGAFLLVGGLHIGLLKILIQNEEQEWWGRTGGLLMLICIGWTLLFALTIFVPWIFASQGEWIKAKVSVLAVWALTTAVGVISGKSPKTSGKGDGNSAFEIVALVSPYVFIVGLMVLLSLGVDFLAEKKWEPRAAAPQKNEAQAPVCNQKDIAKVQLVQEPTGDGCPIILCCVVSMKSASSDDAGAKVTEFWSRMGLVPTGRVWAYFWALLAITFAVAWRVDINIFSMNLLYRNRLVRCYLGASRPDCVNAAPPCKGRHPNPFTGFDPADDTPLAKFRPENKYKGPYPIVCAALNVTHGERLAWQERKAESFVFTPRYCGYEFTESKLREFDDMQSGYQPTDGYAYPHDPQNPFHSNSGGMHLGTAISISGAAASPNMGFHTSPPLAFLMTAFDVRLGWWLANPRYANKKISGLTPGGGPPFALLYLLNELMASTNDQSNFVYLSDGGHFENLAVYELVRRRCKFIIACDGDADEKVQFEDLGNMIRKCRSDFGVEIDIDTTKLEPVGDPKFAKAHGVVGEILYPPAPGKDRKARDKGHLLYIKPAITKDVPRDVLAYRDSHDPFPFQTTADQWFDESQFESYRRLGLYTMQSLMKPTGDNDEPIASIEALFNNVE